MAEVVVAKPAVHPGVDKSFAPKAAPKLPPARPMLDKVVHGDVQVKSKAHSTLIKTGGGKTLSDWHSFNIGKDHRAQIVGKGGVDVLRVNSPDPTRISGSMSVNNTRAFLTNPNGVYFEKGSVVDIQRGAFTAAAASIDTQKFLKGEGHLDVQGDVYNGATVLGNEGDFGLIGRSVTQDGLVVGLKTNVSLISGEVVSFDPEGMFNFEVKKGSEDAGLHVTKNATILTGEGNVYMTMGEAEQVVRESVNKGSTTVAKTSYKNAKGEIVFASTMQVDGTVRTEGGDITMKGNARISGTLDASGEEAGTIQVGGKRDVEGVNPLHWDARFWGNSLELGPTARILSNRRGTGRAGEIFLMANHRFDTAKGSVVSAESFGTGDGGIVEMSLGRGGAFDMGDVALRFANHGGGSAGRFIFDPTYVVVTTLTNSDADTLAILPSQLEAWLNQGDTILTASVNVVFENTVSWSSDHTLQLVSTSADNGAGFAFGGDIIMNGRGNLLLWQASSTAPNFTLGWGAGLGREARIEASAANRNYVLLSVPAGSTIPAITNVVDVQSFVAKRGTDLTAGGHIQDAPGGDGVIRFTDAGVLAAGNPIFASPLTTRSVLTSFKNTLQPGTSVSITPDKDGVHTTGVLVGKIDHNKIRIGDGATALPIMGHLQSQALIAHTSLEFFGTLTAPASDFGSLAGWVDGASGGEFYVDRAVLHIGHINGLLNDANNVGGLVGDVTTGGRLNVFNVDIATLHSVMGHERVGGLVGYNTDFASIDMEKVTLGKSPVAILGKAAVGGVLGSQWGNGIFFRDTTIGYLDVRRFASSSESFGGLIGNMGTQGTAKFRNTDLRYISVPEGNLFAYGAGDHSDIYIQGSFVAPRVDVKSVASSNVTFSAGSYGFIHGESDILPAAEGGFATGADVHLNLRNDGAHFYQWKGTIVQDASLDAFEDVHLKDGEDTKMHLKLGDTSNATVGPYEVIQIGYEDGEDANLSTYTYSEDAKTLSTDNVVGFTYEEGVGWVANVGGGETTHTPETDGFVYDLVSMTWVAVPEAEPEIEVEAEVPVPLAVQEEPVEVVMESVLESIDGVTDDADKLFENKDEYTGIEHDGTGDPDDQGKLLTLPEDLKERVDLIEPSSTAAAGA